MQNNKTFYKRCSTREQTVDFAEKSQGTIQEDGCTVAFDASYSISKALFNVKSDKYRVYIRIRLANGNPLTYIVAAKRSKDAYDMAKNRVKEVRSQSSSSRSAVQQAIIDCSDYIKMVQKARKIKVFRAFAISKRADMV